MYTQPYTQKVNTMADLFETTLICDQCNQKTHKGISVKDGFKMRTWECYECNKQWKHPSDAQEYDNFKKLKQKEFQVKLRYVGNSYTVSIPREIIEFEEELKREFAKMDTMLKMMLERPGKVSIFFSQDIKDLMQDEKTEE